MNYEEQVNLDETDRAILNLIQTGFPIDKKPYDILGQRLGLSGDDVLDRVRAMRKNGVIRRIGGNFASTAVGYASTLCAARVPVEKMGIFIDAVNNYPGVTHNYRRDHDLNVWFTFIAPSMTDIENNLKEITDATGVTDIYNMPAENTFKIKVDFRFDE